VSFLILRQSSAWLDLTTFTYLNPAGGKTRVVIIVENSLAVKANVKLSLDLMDLLIQLVCLHFDAHIIRSGGRGPL
jgi:hypothetical protein